MCGIVGYVGPKEPVPVIIRGLEKLEYRGYDSAGIALVSNKSFDVFRAEGKLSKLKELLTKNNRSLDPSRSETIKLGMGHTRWATHGRPSETNAHPHIAGEICVVHNGIIENYAELRKELSSDGAQFKSETDTEIAAHLIDKHFKTAPNLFAAVKSAIAELKGSYALVVASTKEPETLVVAKNSTPVIVGVGEGENFVASDIPAILEHTRSIIVLEDGDLAEIKKDSLKIEAFGVPVNRKPIHINWDPATAEKGGYRHFMLKEIHEQPQVVTETFRGRLNTENKSVFLDDVKLTDEDLSKINRVCLVACGTAWHAALVAKFYIEKFARLNVEIEYGSEYRYRDIIVDKNTLFAVISQSGETADTLGALELAAAKGATTFAIVNVVGSTISRRAEHVLYTHAGPEISVASTKAFSTQLTAVMLFALRLGIAKKTLSPEQVENEMNALFHLPAMLTHALTLEEKIAKIANETGSAKHFLFLGRGFLYPIALEGALKIKEIAYVHAEGYPGGEMKHGPLALVSEDTPVVVLLGKDASNYEKAMSNLMEVKSRGARIIAVTDVASDELKLVAHDVIEVGECPTSLLPMVLTVPIQLFSYYAALHRGTDIDQPRNLAKSVTVE